jgi:TonB family protein
LNYKIVAIGILLLGASLSFSQDSKSQATTPSQTALNGGSETLYTVSAAVKPPKVLYQPPAEYSEEGRAKRIAGNVELRLIVTAKGEPKNISVVKSLGSGLDEKAVEALKQWRFKPATKDGKPVAVVIAVEVAFHP